MAKFDIFLDTFISGNYFVVFLSIMLIILVVLILALIKSREDYKELLSTNEEKYVFESIKPNEGLNDLVAKTKDDVIDENKPLIKQIDFSTIKTYDDIIDEYETSEEEQAVISNDELEKRKQERYETLGTSDNKIAIQKYEEEQEKKAIISYEQLLKNASNISLSYKEELSKKDGSPKINKIEIEQKEISEAISYLEEEEFLNILKEFRTTL